MYIQIDTQNAAFEDESELNRILNTVAGSTGQKLIDINGNIVGEVFSSNSAEITVYMLLKKAKLLLDKQTFENEFGRYEKESKQNNPELYAER